MNELILHHYPQSPFAEKARLMLGFKGLSWRSVMIPAVMPKPDLTALLGDFLADAKQVNESLAAQLEELESTGKLNSVKSVKLKKSMSSYL